MKKILVGLLMTVAMAASLITVPMAQAADASPFTDVPTDHWAYSNIVELTNAGVVSGMGDGTFEPESELTRAEMTKLLVCATDVYDETRAYNAAFYDVAEDEWYAGYIASGLASGMYGSEYDVLFMPDSALSRGECVEWIINVLGADSSREYSYADISDADVAAAASDATAIGIINGYEDGTFRPDSSLTRAEATAIIKRIMDYIAERDGVRADAANEIVLNDDVIIIESSDDVNIPVAADAELCTVSFKNADSALKGLKTGDILYMPPSATLPDGLVGKVTTVENDTYTTIGLEQASIEEVIKSIDISAYFGVNESMLEDDGDLELISASNSALSTVGSATASTDTDSDSDSDSSVSSVESADNGVKFDLESDAGISEISLKDKKIGVYANASATSTLHYQTPSYTKKESVYAAVNMTLETLVDLKVAVSDEGLTQFDVKTGIDTDIATTAGYKKSGKASVTHKLPTIDIPIAGLVKVVIEPKLVATATGELTIEANATLSNSIGLTYTLDDGFDAYNTTTADSTLSVDAEGELRAGSEIEASLKLCEVKIPILDVTILDGFEVAEANVALGAGANGKLSEELTVSLSDTQASISTGSDDELHPCSFCVGGNIFYYYSGDIGVGDDIQAIYKEIFENDKKLKKTIADATIIITPWHLSIGEGYGLEFELCTCPHIMYKTAVKLVKKDAVPTEYVTGANAAITGNETETLKEDNGSYLIYAVRGLYTVDASKDGYKDAERKVYVYKANEYILEMEEDPEVWAYSANIGEVNGVTYATRSCPGIPALPLGAFAFAEYGDYVYYIVKVGAGTSDYDLWLYRADKNFENAVCLTYDAPSDFVITDNKLYYRYYDKTYIDLNTFEFKTGSEPTRYLTIDGKQKSLSSLTSSSSVYEYNGAVYYLVSGKKSNSIYKIEDGVQTLLVSGKSIYFDGGVAGGYVYYSTLSNNYANLYRIPTSGGDPELVDSHMAAGGGIYFNY